MTPFVPGFTGNSFDRADHLRNDASALVSLRQYPAARVLRLDGLDPLLTENGALIWQNASAVAPETPLILLGLHDNVPHFVVLEEATAPASLFRSPAIMKLLPTLSAEDLATYGVVRSLIDWHSRHGFCARCGTLTQVSRAGWGRHCANCDTEHFPRVDPVVIMLAEHETNGEPRALVGRQLSWPAGRYSALAGYLEPGETIEEAVARELFEEAGVRATSVRYVTSQPWPFPAQLMIACIAPVTSDALKLAPAEIEDAIWVTRGEVRAALAGEASARFIAPPSYAVAHSLLQSWVSESR